MDPVAAVEVNVPVALRTPQNLNFTSEEPVSNKLASTSH